MKRGIIIVGLVFLVFSLISVIRPKPISNSDDPSPSERPAENSHPNVILISLDTLRPDHLGCYGYSRETSPNLDRLARSGVVFKTARSQAPWTLPSHMSLFTSMLPSHNRVEDLNEVLSASLQTLPELMKAAGYETAAVVNNGQMKKHWGFDRGFNSWQEFEVDTPEGNCESITRHAMDWLATNSNSESPFFLFLHYFDVHEPYQAPDKYRERFGVKVTGPETRQIMWRSRTPAQDMTDQEKRAVIDAYDAEIAWLDAELGRLFEVVPDNTLVVVFSDHGEAFDEHGWTLHGATLYEEEIRTLLIMSGKKIEPDEIETPVMLMDVAPTILEMCGVQVPSQFEGMSLKPITQGRTMPERAVLSETKRVLEGKFSRSILAGNRKLVWSFPDHYSVYELPDETDRPSQEDALRTMMSNWNAENGFALITATGEGRFEARITAPPGSLLLFLPIDFEAGRDHFMPSENGSGLHWIAYTNGKPKFMYLEIADSTKEIEIDCLVNDERKVESVFLPAGENPSTVPFRWNPVGGSSSRWDSRTVAEWFPKPGFYVQKFLPQKPAGVKPKGGRLDAKTIQKLKSLGYLQ
ncbi:MAG: sulfatase [Planctomycetota bacterium]|nr:sulfatase [Planctomycetota bacterium]MDA1139930.1 sulfatase [Planctomycetota bacterium]